MFTLHNDEFNRPYLVKHHVLGFSHSMDTVLFQENDKSHYVDIFSTKDLVREFKFKFEISEIPGYK